MHGSPSVEALRDRKSSTILSFPAAKASTSGVQKPLSICPPFHQKKSENPPA
jgi:hypothetical protein